MGMLTFGIGQLDAIARRQGDPSRRGSRWLCRSAGANLSVSPYRGVLQVGMAALGAGLGSMGLNTGIFESIVARRGRGRDPRHCLRHRRRKFQNGAATGAFVYIFNQLASRTAPYSDLGNLGSAPATRRAANVDVIANIENVLNEPV